MEVEVDALGMKLAEHAEQILQRPSEPVDRPRRNHIDVTARNGLKQPIQARSLVTPLRSRDPRILIGGLNIPTMPCSHGLKLKFLVFGALAVRRHAEVQRNPFGLPDHIRQYSQTVFNCLPNRPYG